MRPWITKSAWSGSLRKRLNSVHGKVVLSLSDHDARLRSNTLLATNDPLKTLLRNLLLRRRDDSISVGVGESTASLSVLLASCLGRAYTVTSSSDLTAASGAAVRIGDTTASDELRTVAGTDILSPRVVGCNLGHGDSGH
jgi:hypothetical protein